MTDLICPICNREIPKGKSDTHHLIPVSKKGRTGPTVELHRICHDKIHSLWDNNQLKNTYNTVNGMLESGELDAFVKWVSKKSPDFYDSTTMHNNRKR